MRDVICGIYEIVNIINQKRYIGQSTDIYHRWSCHKCELCNGLHKNTYLQAAWDKYGEDSFEFNILKQCDKEFLNEYECFYIDTFDTMNRDKGYNLKKGGDGVFEMSEETKQKMSEAQRKRWTEELRQELSEKYLGENNPFYGKHHTEESGLKIAEANRQRIWSDESREKQKEWLIKRNKLRKGCITPQCVKDKISNSLKGRPSPNRKPVVQLDLKGNYITSFESIKNASIATGLDERIITACCKGHRENAREFIFKYQEEYNET